MRLFNFLKRRPSINPERGLSPVKLKKGELFHVHGRLKGSVYAYTLICSVRLPGDALSEPIEVNRAIAELILRSERREAKRGAATILFGENPNLTIRFIGTHPKMGAIALISRGITIRAAYLHVPGVAIEICKFLKWQAENMDHDQTGFLLREDWNTSLFWHTAILSSYFRFLWGDRS